MTPDRPAHDKKPEIEVTPEMIAAGANIIAETAKDVSSGWVSAEEVICRIFHATIAL